MESLKISVKWDIEKKKKKRLSIWHDKTAAELYLRSNKTCSPEYQILNDYYCSIDWRSETLKKISTSVQANIQKLYKIFNFFFQNFENIRSKRSIWCTLNHLSLSNVSLNQISRLTRAISMERLLFHSKQNEYTLLNTSV